MTIRPLELDRDADDLVVLVRDAVPTAVVNRAAIVSRISAIPQRAEPRIWIAEVNGEAIGRADAFMNFFSKGSRTCFAGVIVRSDHRRRGIGAQLHELCVRRAEELGAEGLLTNFFENPAGVAFAHALGWREVRAETESILDPRKVTDAVPADVDLRPVTEVDPRLVWRVDVEASLDVPQTETVDDIPYDEWEDHVLRYPLFEPDGASSRWSTASSQRSRS